MPRPTGYALAMNRDEKLTRTGGLPPARHSIGQRWFVCPSEPSGGTWISLNDRGVALALINWYSVQTRVAGTAVSRGEVIRSGVTADSSEPVQASLACISLPQVNPFRLIGVFPKEKQIVEWRWNLEELRGVIHPWELNTWISSGHDEPGAQRTRGAAFQDACGQRSVGDLAWLRRVHRSHKPGRGPYSTCMHRADAAPVSYTEISVRHSVGKMGHIAGAPCCGGLRTEERIELKP